MLSLMLNPRWLLLLAPIAVIVGARLLGIRYIPHNKVGIVEKLWSWKGSLREGRIIALDGRAGFQAEILRGGLHFWYFPWKYRIHKHPLITIPEGKIGYLYARDGQPLPPTQTLGKVVESNNFQDARAFLTNGGQRGRQRAILREGVYAVNQALFVVVAENQVYNGPIPEQHRSEYQAWQSQLREMGGFDPVVIGYGAAAAGPEAGAEAGKAAALTAQDNIAVVIVHDGPPIESGEVIAPEVKPAEGQPDHKYFQDPEAFLALGGCRGKQLQVLTDGTFFINRWFATVEVRPKTVIPIGYVGVVVSYHGVKGEDLTGQQFRYGEQVEPGHRGVWKRPLPPGKYPLNPYALKVELVPTVNFVLRWVTGMMEEHQYDKDLKSIALITADGFEPILPLSLVLHIDYEKAPRVVQRFGDVKRLISQTLDPIISAYFRDVAQTTHMLDLLIKREQIQSRATAELGRRFQEYDINCVAVLIGRPESRVEPAEAGRPARVDIEIAGNRGEAQLAEARRLAKRDVARAQGEGRSKELLGRGEAARIAQTGVAEAAVFLKKIRAYGDPRLFALNRVGEQLSASQQPLVPQRLLMMGGRDGRGAQVGDMSLFGSVIALLLAEKAGLDLSAQPAELSELEQYVQRLVEKAGRETQGDELPDQEPNDPHRTSADEPKPAAASKMQDTAEQDASAKT